MVWISNFESFNHENSQNSLKNNSFPTAANLQTFVFIDPWIRKTINSLLWISKKDLVLEFWESFF